MMKPFKQVFIYILVTLTIVLSQKNSDESRPYEFGFTIDGEQHRHETKDQRGIVQGEFGFITADGVYHVTVYATDENGKFKILSTRNIRISAPLDGSPATGPISPEAGKYLGKQKQLGNTPTASPSSQQSQARPQQYTQSTGLLPQRNQQPGLLPQTNQQSSPQSPQGPQAAPVVTKTPNLYDFTTQPTIKPACGGCGYVTTPKPSEFQFQNPNLQGPTNGLTSPSSPNTVQGNHDTQQSVSSGFVQPSINNQYPQPVQNPYAPPESITRVQQDPSNRLQLNLQNPQIGGLQEKSVTVSPSSGSSGFVQSAINNQYPQPIKSSYEEDSSSRFQPNPQNLVIGGLREKSPVTVSPASGSSGFTQSPINNQYPQPIKISYEQDSSSQLQANPQNPLIGGLREKSPVTPSINTQNQYSPGIRQESFGQISPSGANVIQPRVGNNLLPPGNNQQYQDANRGQQVDVLNGDSNGGLFGKQNAGVNGHIQYPATSSTDFIPNPITHQNPEISKLPPVSVSDNTIHVGGTKPVDIPIRDKYPGMVDGLPNGIEEKDVKDILYKFHYTVGFHGHYEKGLKNGAKIGGYFVNGRDGFSRVVTYVADENGYRPKFKFINLGLDSSDTPKEGTEKTFGLKSFEFVWYPIE